MNLRCFELFAEKLEIGWGKAFSGMFLAGLLCCKKVRHDESTVNTEYNGSCGGTVGCVCVTLSST